MYNKNIKNYLILFLLPVSILIASCQPKVSGTIFLDKNENNTLDKGEKHLGNVPFFVKVNDTKYAEGRSYLDGVYEVKVKEPGYYCINIENLESAVVYTPPAESEIIDTTSTKSASGDAENEEIEDDTESNDESETERVQPTTRTDKRACINIQYSSAEVDIPVHMDVSTAMGEVPEEMSEIEARAGEPFYVDFFIPAVCQKFKTFYPPPELQIGDVWEEKAEGQLVSYSLDEDVFKRVPLEGNITQISESPIDKVRIPMISDPEFIGEKDITVKVKYICPNEKEREAKRKVKLTGKFPIEALPNIMNSSLSDLDPSSPSRSDKIVVVEYAVKNERNWTFDNVEFEVSAISTYESGSVLEIDGISIDGAACHNLGTSGLCDFSITDERKIQVIFLLPPDSWGKTFKTEAVITLRGLASEPTEDIREVRFSVPAYPDTDDDIF